MPVHLYRSIFEDIIGWFSRHWLDLGVRVLPCCSRCQQIRLKNNKYEHLIPKFNFFYCVLLCCIGLYYIVLNFPISYCVALTRGIIYSLLLHRNDFVLNIWYCPTLHCFEIPFYSRICFSLRHQKQNIGSFFPRGNIQEHPLLLKSSQNIRFCIRKWFIRK